MFSFFEQPWTLLGVAVLFLFGILTFRSVWPEKKRWWQLLIPFAIAAAGFGTDFLVKTDLEKIKYVLQTGIRAVEQQNADAIEKIIANNYHDSYHDTKNALMAHCRSELSQPQVEKCKKVAVLIKISAPDAKVILTVLLRFDKNSRIYQNYKPSMFVKTELSLQKQSDNRWLINRIEILEIDKQPISWRQIR